MPKIDKTKERSNYKMGQLKDLVQKQLQTSLTPWAMFLEPYMNTQNFKIIDKAYTNAKLAGCVVYPEEPDIFAAFAATPPEKVKAVILGQDPYHGPGEAMGLAFSVRNGRRPQPSLTNIKRELAEDIPGLNLSGNDLTPWARQGVLLLNTSLTVLARSPGSHANIGWRTLTSAALSYLLWTSAETENAPLAFILWGRHAQDTGHVVLSGFGPHKRPVCILESPHPSPYSADRGFFGSRPFSKTNSFLTAHNTDQIDWSIPG